jgi:hypothetical protein
MTTNALAYRQLLAVDFVPSAHMTQVHEDVQSDEGAPHAGTIVVRCSTTDAENV